MGPESHLNPVTGHGWAPTDTAAGESTYRNLPSANLDADASEDTLFDYAEDRGYDLGEGD